MAKKGRGAKVNGNPQESAGAEIAEAAQMFIEDLKHVNCAVAGAQPEDEGFLSVTFQVGPRKYESFLVGPAGQEKIEEAIKAARQSAKGGIEVARGPLPPHPGEREA